MTDGPLREARERRGSRLARLLIVLGGIVLGQVVLYGPSLAGHTILLPLDILAQPGMYLPRTPEVADMETQNPSLSDLVEVAEPARRFGHEEFHAGRMPKWTPYNYAGAPFTRSNFSPFFVLECLVGSPVVLAWTQMLVALAAGFGAYFFCRRVLAVGFWPGAVAAWCYPLTGFFVFWQGYPTSLPVVWLPWVLWVVDRTVRGSGAFAPIGLSVITCLVLVSGQLDVAAQVMLASGLFALWALCDANRGRCFGRQMRFPGTQNSRPLIPEPARALATPSFPHTCGGEGRGEEVLFFRKFMGRKALALVGAWALGFLLAAPYLLPMLDYAHTGARLARRGVGEEERPPVGWKALPQIVLPYMYGTRETGSLRVVEGNELESSAATYAGIIATLLAAPLAWSSRRHRSINVFFALLSFVSLSWCLNVPGYVDLLRLPGLNMMSHNRFVFAASFAIVATMAIGLETLRAGPVRWRWWFWIAAGVLGLLFCWCLFRAAVPPEPVASDLPKLVPNGYSVRWIHTVDDVVRLKFWYGRYYLASASWCGLGLAGWLILRRQPAWGPRLFPALALVLVADLLWFGFGRNPQCSPALYFPPIPALDETAKSVPGRIIGADCLPASLASMRGLRDIRGYDGVDPARIVELAPLYAADGSKAYSYAATRRVTPRYSLDANGELRFPPVLDMLGVRYFVGRGTPPPGSHPAFQSEDYWVVVNSNALPRAFVPERVETVADSQQRLKEMAAETFDARKVAYIESAVEVPAACRGAVEITSENPQRITLALRMETPCLVVLADLWDKGWRAYLNGTPAPILRTDHALRGVVVPSGPGTLEFRYEPGRFKWGFALAGFALVALITWAAVAWRAEAAK